MSQDARSHVPLIDLLPHRPPMLLLDEVIEHDRGRTTCQTTVREDARFREPGGLVPGWVALEYMAQCIGVHTGLRARAAGRRPPLGFLIGARQVDFHTPGFACGQILLVMAEHVWGETSLGAFACRVHDASTRETLAEGALKVFAPDDLDALVARTPK